MDSSRDQHRGGAAGGDRPPRRIRVEQAARGGRDDDAGVYPGGAAERRGGPGLYGGGMRRHGAPAPASGAVAAARPAAAAAADAPQVSPGSRQPARTRRYVLIGGATLAALLCVLFIAFSQTGAKCPGVVKLKGPKHGSTVRDTFTLGVSVENRRCISAVTYQIDGADIATETNFPYEVRLHAPTLAQKLRKQETHEVTATVEEPGGDTHTLEERLTLSFSADATPAADAAEEPGPTAPPATAATASALAPPATASAPAPPATTGPAADARHDELSAQCRQLASQISGKSGYIFAPEFTRLVAQRLDEYRGIPAGELARRYRYEVNKAFGDVGVAPIVGYVLAFSRSRFDVEASGPGVGLWQIPPNLARSSNYLAQDESDASLKDPKRSAEIAALYFKELRNSFDAEDFIYAVASFGASVSEAGQLSARLNEAAPDPASRRDIMKMSKAGVLTPAQVDRVARFFAAGIIGEHPQSFNRKGGPTFSSLY